MVHVRAGEVAYFHWCDLYGADGTLDPETIFCLAFWGSWFEVFEVEVVVIADEFA